MSDQLQSDFDKLVKTSKFSSEEIKFKKNFLNNFIKNGFPNRNQEDWKFLDISKIIKKNFSDLAKAKSFEDYVEKLVGTNLAKAFYKDYFTLLVKFFSLFLKKLLQI